MDRSGDEDRDMTTHADRQARLSEETHLRSTSVGDTHAACGRSDLMKAVFAMNPKIRDALNQIHPKTYTDVDGTVRQLRCKTVKTAMAIPNAPVTEWMPIGHADIPAVVRVFGMPFDGFYHRDFMDHDGRPTYSCRQIRSPPAAVEKTINTMMLYYSRPTGLWLLGRTVASERAFARCKDPRVSPDGLNTWEEFASSNLTDCVPGRSWDLWSFRIERLLELVPKHRVLVTTIQEASLDDGFRRIVEFVTTRKDEGLIVDDGSKPWTRRMNVGQGQHVENSALKQTCSSKELLSVLHERFHDEVHRLQRLLAMFGSRTELTFEC